MNWRGLDVEPAPRDRPVAFLSVQPQRCGGRHVTIDVVQWRDEHGCFVLGYDFDTGVGHGCGTHWCEVGELNLPAVPSC